MYTWAAAWQYQQNGHCAQRRNESAWASAQSDQSLCCLHEETMGPQLPIERTAKTDPTGRMPRLIWIFAGRKGHFVGFDMRWLTLRKCILIFASGLRNLNHNSEGRALYRSRQWVWLQSQWSLDRAPALPHTGNTCNLRRINHEIMYMVFLLFSLIQERQFSVISESICAFDHFVLINRLEKLSLSARRSGVGRTFNCTPGNHRPRISQADLLLRARDSRKPNLA